MKTITTLYSKQNGLDSWDEDTYDAVMKVIKDVLVEKGYSLDKLDNFSVYVGIDFEDGE